MLVLVPGEVVDTIHVSPVNDGGDIVVGLGNKVPGVGGVLHVTTLELSPGDTAATGGGGLVDGGVGTVVGVLREGVDGEVVFGVVLLGLGGLMPGLLSPGVLGGGPRAIRLDGNVVGASADAEETFLTPVLTPGVTDEPVRAAILLTVANNGDVVNNVHVTSVVTVDATGVVIEGLRDGDTASDGSSLDDLLHHVLLADDFIEFVNTVDHVLVGDEAGLTGVAVAANVHGRADLTVVEATGAVDGASLISHLVVGHPLEGIVGLTTVATHVLGLTRDDDLGGDVDIGPGALTRDLDSIREGRGGGMGPAGATVLRDVLVADVGDHVLSVDVVPEHVGGEVLEGLERSVYAGLTSVEVADAAGLLGVDLAESESGSAKHGADSEGFHEFCFKL